MRNQLGKIAIGCVLAVAGMPSAAYPQAPAPAAPNGSVVVASPTYTSIIPDSRTAKDGETRARFRVCQSHLGNDSSWTNKGFT
jgi:hypothetical protein